jgi:hypothetical protein
MSITIESVNAARDVWTSAWDATADAYAADAYAAEAALDDYYDIANAYNAERQAAVSL